MKVNPNKSQTYVLRDAGVSEAINFKSSSDQSGMPTGCPLGYPETFASILSLAFNLLAIRQTDYLIRYFSRTEPVSTTLILFFCIILRTLLVKGWQF